MVVHRGREKWWWCRGKERNVVVQRERDKWRWCRGKRAMSSRRMEENRAMGNKEKTELFPNVTWYLDPDFNNLKQVVSPKHLPQFLC